MSNVKNAGMKMSDHIDKKTDGDKKSGSDAGDLPDSVPTPADYEIILDKVRKELENEIKHTAEKAKVHYIKELGEKDSKSEDSGKRDSEINSIPHPDEVDRIIGNMARAHVFLEYIGIKEIVIDLERFLIIVPFEYEDYRFLSQIVVSPDWFIAKASIIPLSNIPEHLYTPLFFELLKSNFILNDVTYSIDPEGENVWCESDIPTDCDFEFFRLNYLSLVFAIDYFINNIAKEMRMENNIRSTYKSGSNDAIYI